MTTPPTLTDERITEIFESAPRWHYPPIGATDREFARDIKAAVLAQVDAELAALRAECERLKQDAARWRYWRNFWPALCRMEVARFARLDLRTTYVQGPTDMDTVTDAAIATQAQEPTK